MFVSNTYYFVNRLNQKLVVYLRYSELSDRRYFEFRVFLFCCVYDGGTGYNLALFFLL